MKKVGITSRTNKILKANWVVIIADTPQILLLFLKLLEVRKIPNE